MAKKNAADALDNDVTIFEDLKGNIADDQMLGDDDPELDEEEEEERRPRRKKQREEEDDEFEEDEFEEETDDERDRDDGDDDDADDELDEEDDLDDEEDDQDEDDGEAEINKLPLKQKFKDRLIREYRLRESAREKGREVAVELHKEKAASLEYQKMGAKLAKETLELKIKDAKRELLQAKEDGKSDVEVDWQSKLNEFQQQLGQVNAHAAQLEGIKLGENAEDPYAGEARSTGGRVKFEPSGNPHLDKWLKRNTWFRSNPKKTEIALEIEKDMKRKGWRANSPDYFEELDRKINRRMGKMRGVRGRSAPGAEEGRRSPVSGQRGSQRGGSGSSKKVDLDMRQVRPGVYAPGSDAYIAQQFGNDPKNPKIRKALAGERKRINESGKYDTVTVRRARRSRWSNR